MTTGVKTAELALAMEQLRGVIEERPYGGSLMVAARRVLAAYDANPEHMVWVEPVATVTRRGTLGVHEEHRLHLGDLVHNEIPALHLDAPLHIGDTLVVDDDRIAGQELIAHVRGVWVRFMLVVTCGKCVKRAAHLIEVPGGPWGRAHPTRPCVAGWEPYVVRRCDCGDVWRQHPLLVPGVPAR